MTRVQTQDHWLVIMLMSSSPKWWSQWSRVRALLVSFSFSSIINVDFLILLYLQIGFLSKTIVSRNMSRDLKWNKKVIKTMLMEISKWANYDADETWKSIFLMLCTTFQNSYHQTSGLPYFLHPCHVELRRTYALPRSKTVGNAIKISWITSPQC